MHSKCSGQHKGETRSESDHQEQQQRQVLVDTISTLQN